MPFDGTSRSLEDFAVRHFTHQQAAKQSSNGGISAVLDRLDKARQTAPGRWIAACPAHDDRSPSLSIRELDDGRVLLHDFGGCHVEDVLSALGITLASLFPDGPIDHNTKPTHSRIAARDLLAIIDHQASMVAVIASDMLESRSVDEPTFAMLAEAARRIGEARDAVAPARAGR